MDIGALSTALASSQINSQFGVAMLSKTLDTQKTESQGLIEMIDSASMERSVNPNIGSNFDMSV